MCWLNVSHKYRRIWHRLTPLALVLGLWGGVISLFSIQAVVVFSTSWTSVFSQVYSYWLVWVLFLPLIVWLSLRYPLQRSKMLPQLGIHIVACTLILVLNQIACRTFLPLVPPAMGHETPQRAGTNPLSAVRVVPDIIVYLVTMGTCVVFRSFRDSRERERHAMELEARLAQAKLQALRMQVNPHFLFNTLNAISTLIHTNPQIADDMVADLSELFRISLESSDDQEIPLSQELGLLERYLAIEQRRFGERLQVQQSITPELLNAAVPTLILQPIVENAIRHGIAPYKNVGKIAILGRQIGNQMILSVSDNGKMPVDYPSEEAKSSRHGIGLSNTQARLQQLYGEERLLTVHQGELGGWKVEMRIPIRPAMQTNP
jgi:two-component system, LytTR family, sensor kinase